MGRVGVLTVALTLACMVAVSASTDDPVSAQTVAGSADSALTSEEREKFAKGAKKVAGLEDEEIERVLENPEMIDDIPVSRGPVTSTVRKADSRTVTSRAAGETKRKVMTIPYEDTNGEVVLKLVVTKVWTFGGGQVTYGNMTAESWVREDARYSPDGGGWRYAKWAEFSTDKFVRWDGRDQGGHRSTLAGLFELTLPGATQTSGWVLMGAIQVGRHNGACDSTTYVPKNPQYNTRPQPLTTEREARFGFSLEAGAHFECARDGATLRPCTSPVSYDSLAEGEHTFRFQAIDANGSAALRLPLYEWTIDTIPPKVASIEPSAGATDVPAGARIRVVFSEDVRALSLPGAITLTRFDTGEAVAGFVGYEPSAKRAVFIPDAPLEPGVRYTARIEGGERGVKDHVGFFLAQDKVWNFAVAP